MGESGGVSDSEEAEKAHSPESSVMPGSLRALCTRKEARGQHSVVQLMT